MGLYFSPVTLTGWFYLGIYINISISAVLLTPTLSVCLS